MLKEMLESVRLKRPLIHSITNYVSMNDCANILLACGASPIMADDPQEAAEITGLSCALNINIGTLQSRNIESMLSAGKAANRGGKPVVLDPVGTGASKFRTDTAVMLTRELDLSVIKANISEMKSLMGGSFATGGVDVSPGDTVTEKDAELACAAARRFKSVIIITGEKDIITDGYRTFCIYNGHPLMSRVTGTGCQLSALTAAFAGANKEDMLCASVAAVCAMGVCGETAYERMEKQDGTASFRNYIIDAISNLDGETLERRAKYKIL